MGLPPSASQAWHYGVIVSLISWDMIEVIGLHYASLQMMFGLFGRVWLPTSRQNALFETNFGLLGGLAPSASLHAHEP